MPNTTIVAPDSPQPISVSAGVHHDPQFGSVTPIWYGTAMYVEVRGSRTGVDLDVVVYAKNRMGQFRPQTRLTPDRPIETHADAVQWVWDWLTDRNNEVAA